MSNRIIDWKSGVVTTTDATQTTLCTSDTVPDGATVVLEANIQGRNTSTGALASATINHRAKRVSGVLSMIGSASALVSFATGSDAAMATCLADIDSSSNALRLRITGIVATSIEWFGDMRIRIN